MRAVIGPLIKFKGVFVAKMFCDLSPWQVLLTFIASKRLKLYLKLSIKTC